MNALGLAVLRSHSLADLEAMGLKPLLEQSEEMPERVEATASATRSVVLVDEILRRSETGLKKRPATAELLNWLLVLNQTCDRDRSLAEQEEQVLYSLSALIKNNEDNKAAEAQWRKRTAPQAADLRSTSDLPGS